MRSAASMIASMLFRVLASPNQYDELHADLDERYRRLLVSRGRIAAEVRTVAATCRLVPFLLRDRIANRQRRSAGGIRLELIQVLRGLRRSRGTAGIITIALGAGTAAVTVVFSVFANVLPRHTRSVQEPQDLVNISFDRSDPLPRISIPHFEEIAHGMRGITNLASYNGIPAHISAADHPAEQLDMELVTEHYFEVLQLRAVTGRTFVPDDFAASAPRAIVIRQDLAARYFGQGNPVGSVLAINGHPFEIVGVIPRDYHGPWNGTQTQVWSPVAHSDLLLPGMDAADLDTHFFYHLMGRVPAGESVEPVRTRLQFLLDRMAARDSADAPNLIPARDGVVITRNAWLMRYYLEPIQRLYRTLAGGSLLVFAVATVNAGLLLLLRSYRRQRDAAIRLAIGAGRASLIRMGLMEALALSIAGGLLAVTLTAWLLDALAGLRILTVTRAVETFDLDASVLVLTLATVVVAGIMAGIAPTLFNIKLAPPHLLRSGSMIGGDRGKFATIAAVTQIALLTPIVLSASLLIRTMTQLDAIDFGIDDRGLYSGALDLWPHELEQDEIRQTYRAIVDHLRTAGSPQSAIAWVAEMSGRRPTVRVTTAATTDTTAQIRLTANQVSEGYFRTLGIDVLSGRDFSRGEVLTGEGARTGVAIVNRRATERLWGNANAVGRTLYAVSPDRILTVVGVVDDVRTVTPFATPEPFLWEPLGQRGYTIPQAVIHIATASGLATAVSRMQDAVASAIPNVPVHSIRSHADQVRGHLITQINLSRTALGLSVVSLALAGIGVFGVIGHSVATRRGELAVRMALGARPASISGHVFGRVARIAGLGIIFAVPGSVLAVHALRDQLYQVKMLDPASLLATVLIIGTLCACAASMPARRAARVSVVEILRES